MSKPLTPEQERVLQQLQQAKAKQHDQTRMWGAGAGKVKKTTGAGVNPHIPQKKP